MRVREIERERKRERKRESERERAIGIKGDLVRER